MYMIIDWSVNYDINIALRSQRVWLMIYIISVTNERATPKRGKALKVGRTTSRVVQWHAATGFSPHTKKLLHIY